MKNRMVFLKWLLQLCLDRDALLNCVDFLTLWGSFDIAFAWLDSALGARYLPTSHLLSCSVTGLPCWYCCWVSNLFKVYTVLADLIRPCRHHTPLWLVCRLLFIPSLCRYPFWFTVLLRLLMFLGSQICFFLQYYVKVKVIRGQLIGHLFIHCSSCLSIDYLWFRIIFGISSISSPPGEEGWGSLGKPCVLLSPLNSFNISILTNLGFPFSYTSITSITSAPNKTFHFILFLRKYSGNIHCRPIHGEYVWFLLIKIWISLDFPFCKFHF